MLGRLGGLHRKRFYFGRDHGEASTGLARARGFNRGIERKQICLPRNVANQVDDLADLLNRIVRRAICSLVVCASATECEATSAAWLI